MEQSKLRYIAYLLAGFTVMQVATAADYPARVARLVANTKKTIKIVDMAQFKTRYDKKDAGLIIDVREPDEYAAGHVRGAVNIPRGRLEFGIWKHVGGAGKPNYRQTLSLYCSTGVRSTLATKTLKDLGFTDVTEVDMKFAEWETAGYPVEMRQ